MVRNKFAAFAYVIIGLAVIGIISQLFTNTVNFFINVFVTLAIGIAIFGVAYFIFFRKRAPSNDMKKYKQAVKQSKAKYKQNHNSKSDSVTKKRPQPVHMKKKSTKRATHLRVIDGNKPKRKNRATF